MKRCAVCHGWLALLILLGYSQTSGAAPPNVTGLFPAGGQRGTTVDITAIGSFDVWPTQVWTSSPHLVATPGKDKGKLSIKIAPEALPGIYWLRCYDPHGAGPLRPFIVGNIPEHPEIEPNDTLLKSQQMSVPAVVNGKLSKNGDVDCYAVSLKKGQTLVASVESNQTLRSAGDMVMQLVKHDGTVLAQNHDYHGLDPQMTYTAPVDGPVIVRLFAFPANPDSSIRFSGGELYIYRLTLTTGGFADYALPLAVNEGKPEPVRLVGWNLNAETMKGTVVPHGDTASVYHPYVSGTPFVRHERWPLIDDTLPVPSSRPPLSVPVCITAELQKERPYYQAALQLTKGRKLAVEVISQSLDLLVDPMLSIRDAMGKEVLKAETNALHSDLKAVYTPPQDGLYTFHVRDLHGRSGHRMAFLLRVAPEEPDFSLSVDTDRFTLTPGKPLDIVVKVTHLGGFKEEVTLAVEGLPRSVKVQTLSTSTDKKTCTLRLEIDQPASVSCRIVGVSAKQPLLKRTAIAPVPDLGSTTSDLWLTVLKK